MTLWCPWSVCAGAWWVVRDDTSAMISARDANPDDSRRAGRARRAPAGEGGKVEAILCVCGTACDDSGLREREAVGWGSSAKGSSKAAEVVERGAGWLDLTWQRGRLSGQMKGRVLRAS